jgi:hypothetical protein
MTDDQKFFDRRDDLARAIRAAQLRNDQAGASVQRQEDMLLVLERYADLAQCGEDQHAITAALRLLESK